PLLLHSFLHDALPISNPMFLELGDGVEQVLGARAGMTTGIGENRGDLRVILLFDPERPLESCPESQGLDIAVRRLDGNPADCLRSEEHTSELQSPYDL